MPHKTYAESQSGLVGALKFAAQILADAGSAKSVYAPITPLYLDNTNIYNIDSLNTGQDPLRPYFGHWFHNTAILLDPTSAGTDGEVVAHSPWLDGRNRE